jgi:hypothetical protein
MRVAAYSPDADPFTFKIFRSFDFRFAKETMSQDIFHAADKNDICRTLNVGAYIADPAG